MRIVLATENQGKVKEFKALLQHTSLEIMPQSHFSMESVLETGQSFVENAILKARHAAHITKLPALADDSGLVVPALFGEPGIYSARYASANASDDENIKKLLQKMKNLPDKKRNAFFYCVLVFMYTSKDPAPLIAEGRWQGRILEKPAGQEGFGYDPIFYVPNMKKTSAELSFFKKNKLSHRGRALSSFLTKLRQARSNESFKS